MRGLSVQYSLCTADGLFTRPAGCFWRVCPDLMLALPMGWRWYGDSRG
jgi:hypothetical protein